MTLRYSVVSTNNGLRINGKDVITSEVIAQISGFDSTGQELKLAFSKLARTEKVSEITAFKDCKALRLFLSALPSKSDVEYIKDNFIGNFKFY